MENIVLSGYDSPSLIGVKYLLDTERIPYTLKEDQKSVSLSVGECLVVVKPEFKEMPIEDAELTAVKFERIIDVLKKFGFTNIKLPVEKVYEYTGSGDVLASFEDTPAIVKEENKILFLFDVGGTFVRLLREEYFEKSGNSVLTNPLIGIVYSKLPYAARILFYRRYYKNLHKKLDEIKGFKTAFPIDTTAFVLLELIKESLGKFTNVPSIGRFPHPYRSAVMLTHDIEPTKYAYRQGLRRLFDVLNTRKSAITLVAESLDRFFMFQTDLEKLRKHDVNSHGLTHNRRFSSISREERKEEIKKSKQIIEHLTGKRVYGFRAPAVEKTEDLFELLEEAGFKYDMSCIDAHREDKYCGSGVSFFLPFHPLTTKGDYTNLLEIPTTSPDCISPYFFGFSMEDTLSLFERKIEWMKTIGGVGNYIIHAGVYGDEDSRKRMELLAFIMKKTDSQSVWNTTPHELYTWWMRRERLELKVRENVVLVNHNEVRMSDVSVSVGERTITIPEINPGESVVVA